MLTEDVLQTLASIAVVAYLGLVTWRSWKLASSSGEKT